MANLNTEVSSLTLNDGTRIPMLGFGTGTAMSKAHDARLDSEKASQIKMAIDLGYHHLDGAESYGTEEELGKAIKESKISREKLFVTTKVSANIKDIPNAISMSLKKLQLDFVDLYLIHQPFDKSDEELQTAWLAMEDVKKSGKAKSIGVSNYLQSHLETTLKVSNIVPSINQIEYHPYLQHNDLLSFHKSKGIATAAYAPITAATRAKPGPCDDVLAALAKKYAVNEAEICLRWCIDRDVVAITTSSKEQRLSDYMRATAFRLTPREQQDLSERGAEKHYRGFWTKKYGPEDRS